MSAILIEHTTKTEYILREANSQFKNPVMLWSMGKDSTALLHMAKDCFYGEIPFPVMHLDTGQKFPEMYDFRDEIADELDLDLIVATNPEPRDYSFDDDTIGCCNHFKTGALKAALGRNEFDAVILGIRWDEHYIRNIERYFSPRDDEFKWHVVRPKEVQDEGDTDLVSEQEVELWDLWQTDFGDSCSHVRVHPILHWTELDIWKYIQNKNVPSNPLYFANEGQRFRSLGCVPCTKPIQSEAKTIDDIISELEVTKEREREGRCQDKEDAMRKLRALGYM